MITSTVARTHLHRGAAERSRLRWLHPLFGILLLALLTVSARSQVIYSYFNDGNGTGAEPALDQYPGAVGNGWGTAWSTLAASGNPLPLVYATNSVTPMNGNTNFVTFFSQGTGTSTKNATALLRSFDPAVLNVFQPYTVQFDFREDGYYNGATLQTNLVTSGFNSANDYVTFVQEGNTSNDVLQRRTAWWIKAAGATTSGSPGQQKLNWAFFDGNLGNTKETGGMWISTTNVPLIAGNVYHFTITVWPMDNYWEGNVSNLNTGSNFNTTAYLGRKLKNNDMIMSSGFSGDFWHCTNLVFINKEATAANSNQISLANIVITQFPTNQWPPVIQPIVYDSGVSNVYNPNQVPGWVPGRANYKTWATSPSYSNYPTNNTVGAGTSFGLPMYPGTPFSGCTWFPYTSNWTFVVTSPSATNTLPASGVQFYLNGSNVTSGVTFGGSDTDQTRTNYYSHLQDNTVYTNVIVVTDSAGATTTCVTFFNTFDTNTMIDFEAENFDFDPAVANAGVFCVSGYASTFTPAFTNRFIQNWVECDAQANNPSGPYVNPGLGYFALAADEGIDYQAAVTNSAGGNFRNCMNDLTINNSASDDFQRPEPYNALDVEFNETLRNLGLNASFAPSQWFNYTHVYTNASPYYIAYFRGGSIISNFVAELDAVTNGFGTSSQASNYLGEFDIPLTAQFRSSTYFDYLATTGTPGNTAMLNLSGQVTLKLSIKAGDVSNNGNAQADAFELIPVPQPTLSSPTLSGPSFSFSFTSIPNAHYTVQYKTNLTDPTWTTLTTVNQAPSTSTTVTDTVGAGPRFYRVSVP